MKKTNCKVPHRGFIGIAALLLPLFLLSGINVQAQNNIIKGTISDARNLPLPGVTILIEGTTLGVVSDNDGHFSITIPRRPAVLILSSVGYKTRRITLTDQTTLTIQLQEDIQDLDEVTVIAYGSQKTRNVVGAVSVLKKGTFDELVGANLETSVQGRLAGVSILQQSGAPGGGDAKMEIRGFSNITDNSGPLYVIDGVPVISDKYTSTGTNPLSEIDSKDIETMTVLKDASSAAIYGSRAANGVVIITTRQGRFNAEKSNIKASVSYTATFNPNLPHLTMGTRERNFRLQALRNYQESFYDQENNTYRYPTSYEDAYNNGVAHNYFWGKGEGADLLIYQDSLNPFYSNNTNLLKHYFQPAHTLNANLQFTGGSPKIAYHVGLGFYQEKGTLRNTGFDRYNVISNLSFKPIENLQANLRLYMAYTDNNRSGKGKDIFDFSIDDGIDKIPQQLLTTSAVLPGPGTPAFEALMAKYDQTLQKNNSGRFRGGLDISYTLFNSLTLKAFGAFDFNLINNHTFQPSTVTADRKSYSSEQFALKMMCMFEGTANYNLSLGDLHNIEALIGYSLQRDAYTEAGLYGKGSPTDLIHYITWNSLVYDQKTNTDLKDATSDYQKSILLGWFARINYNYAQKYLFSASLRRDASSKFGEKVRWGTFPSVGVGYAVSEEPFMDWADNILDYAKIRASWGRSGRQFNDPDIAYGKLDISEPFLGSTTVIPQVNEGLINQRLTWEETDQYNIGLDLNLFKHRLNFTFDYYYKYTDKLLYLVPLPGTHTGFVHQWRNAYALSNEGIEFTLSGDLIRNKNFNWNAALNISRNWNRLEKSYDGYDFTNEDTRYINNLSVIGKPLNGIYVYKDGGIYDNQAQVPTYYFNGRKTPLMGSGNQFYIPGDRIFTDVDHNGRVEFIPSLADDRIYAGSPEPKINWGFTNTFRYKTLSVEIHFIGAAGRTILRQGDNSLATYISPDPYKTASPILSDLSDKTFWQRPGDNADYPRNSAEAGKKNFATNILSNVQKVHFAKLKNITVKYDLPQEITDKIGFNAGIYASAQNICTITNYKGPDPESVSRNTGVDSYGNYPLSRILTLGLTVNF